MSDKFQNKYRIPSARLENWDYGSNAMYFVTICTAYHECYFGEIGDTPNLAVSFPIMVLSEIGKIAHQYWRDISVHFPFVILGEWVVMPNHVHGIIIIDKPDNVTVETPKLGVSTPQTNLGVSTTPNLQRQQTINASKKWKPESLGVIINQYKRAVTINARKIHAGFTWQSRFYDHIIRDDESFQRFSNYIRNNPSKWKGDKFFKS